MKKSQEGDMPAKEHAIDETIDEIIRYRLKICLDNFHLCLPVSLRGEGGVVKDGSFQPNTN